MIASLSSSGNSAGTIPDVNMLLMSSKNPENNNVGSEECLVEHVGIKSQLTFLSHMSVSEQEYHLNECISPTVNHNKLMHTRYDLLSYSPFPVCGRAA